MKSQTSFRSAKQTYAFGGQLLKRAKNRHARPVSTKDPTHLVLKSSRAVGRNSFGHSRNVRVVRVLVDRHCAKYGVKLMIFSNNFTHLHFLVKFPSRALYLRFVRSLTGALAMAITGAKKGFGKLDRKSSCTSARTDDVVVGEKKRRGERFFDFRPFTRIVRGLRPYQIVCDYIRLNQLEAEGVIPYQKERLRNLSELERSFF